MVKGWTIETLKEHFEKVLAERDKAITSALQAAEKAVAVAEANAEKWRNQANEWRGAMTDREKNFITRREVWIAIVAIIGFVFSALQYFK